MVTVIFIVFVSVSPSPRMVIVTILLVMPPIPSNRSLLMTIPVRTCPAALVTPLLRVTLPLVLCAILGGGRTYRRIATPLLLVALPSATLLFVGY